MWPPEVGRGGLKLRPGPSGPPPACAPSPEALESPRCKGQGRQQTAARHHSYLRDKPRNWLGSLSAIGWGQRLTINWKYWQPPLRSPRLAAPGFPARLGTRRACAHQGCGVLPATAAHPGGPGQVSAAQPRVEPKAQLANASPLPPSDGAAPIPPQTGAQKARAGQPLSSKSRPPARLSAPRVFAFLVPAFPPSVRFKALLNRAPAVGATLLRSPTPCNRGTFSSHTRHSDPLLGRPQNVQHAGVLLSNFHSDFFPFLDLVLEVGYFKTSAS